MEISRSLLRIAEAPLSVSPVEEVLDTLVREAAALVGAANGVAGIRGEQGMVCARYFQSGKFLPLHYCWPPGHGLPGWLILHKVPYLTNDASVDTQSAHELREQFGVFNALSTPILSSDGEVIGFFELHNKPLPPGFTTADRDLLVAVSRSASSALQSALANLALQAREAALRRANEELEARVAERAEELTRANAQLRHEQQRLRSLFHRAPAAIFVLRGPSHIVELTNLSAWRLPARRPLTGRPIAEVLPELQRQGYVVLLDEVYKTGKRYVGSEAAVRLDGEGGAAEEEQFFDFVFQPTQDARGRVEGIFVHAYPVTELVRARRRAEELAVQNAELLQAAQEAERIRAAELERLRQVLDQLPEGVLIADRDGRFLLFNAAALAIAGRPPGDEPPDVDLERYAVFGVRHLDGSLYRADELPTARSLLHGEIVRGEQLLVPRRAGGELLPLLASSAPLRDVTGAITGAVTIYQDITAIKDLERRKDEFLATISHDLKTPLTSIKGLAQLLLRQATRTGTIPAERLLSALASMDGSVAQMAAMIDELLDLSRLQMGRSLELEYEPVDLIALAREAVDLAQRSAESHRIVLQTDETELVGDWDRSRLQRVLANLLSNATKYSPEGGEVELRLALDADGGGSARLTIRDEGVGIPSQDLPHIFERFYRGANTRGQAAGMGIGLAGARQIVEQHGGTITIASVEDAGTTVTVVLPLSARDA